MHECKYKDILQYFLTLFAVYVTLAELSDRRLNIFWRVWSLPTSRTGDSEQLLWGNSVLVCFG